MSSYSKTSSKHQDNYLPKLIKTEMSPTKWHLCFHKNAYFCVVMSFTTFVVAKISSASAGGKKSPAIAIAVTAVALSIAIMIASAAIANGFRNEIIGRIIGINSHAGIYPALSDSVPMITLTPQLKSLILTTPGVEDVFPEITVPAVIKTPGDFKGIYLKGIASEYSRNFLESMVVEGVIPRFTDCSSDSTIVLSRMAADELKLRTGDKINTYFMTDGLMVRPLRIAAIIDTHFENYDNIYAFGSINLVRDVTGTDSLSATTLKLITRNFDISPQINAGVQNRLDKAFLNREIDMPYKVVGVEQQSSSFFNWLSLLDTNVAVIIILMLIVATAALISALLIIILDKVKLIGTLKALGAPNSKIARIFVLISMRISITGLLIGNVITLIFLKFQEKYHFLKLDADAYYIDFVPVNISLTDILLLNAGAVLLIWLTLLLPARYVAGIAPANAMRYE